MGTTFRHPPCSPRAGTHAFLVYIILATILGIQAIVLIATILDEVISRYHIYYTFVTFTLPTTFWGAQRQLRRLARRVRPEEGRFADLHQ